MFSLIIFHPTLHLPICTPSSHFFLCNYFLWHPARCTCTWVHMYLGFYMHIQHLDTGGLGGYYAWGDARSDTFTHTIRRHFLHSNSHVYVWGTENIEYLDRNMYHWKSFLFFCLISIFSAQILGNFCTFDIVLTVNSMLYNPL